MISNIFAFSPKRNLIFNTNDVIQIKKVQGEKVGDWKRVYTKRINSLFSSLPGHSNNKGWEFLAKIQNLNDTSGSQFAYNYTYNILENVFNTRYNSFGGLKKNTASYTAAFITTDKGIEKGLGLSQFVLETTLACLWFSGNGRDWSCKALPYLKLASLNLAYNKLNKRGINLVESDFSDPDFKESSKVDLNRAMILTRSILPVFLSTSLSRPGITNDIWDNSITLSHSGISKSLSMSEHFSSKLTNYMNEINAGIKDFYAHLYIKQFKGSPKDFFKNYTTEGSIDQCEQQRKKVNYKILKCTNNQVMASFLGQLLIRYMNNWNKSKSHSIFSKLIETGIYTVTDGAYYHISDYYRTQDKKVVKGVVYKKPQGLTYSSLQYKMLVIAAEIMKNNNAPVDLYTTSDKKLLKGLNSLSHIMNSVPSKEVFKGHKSNFISFEYCKYLNQDESLTSCRDSNGIIKKVSTNWMRNNGFIVPVIKRHCHKSDQTTKHICKQQTDLTPGHNYFVPKSRVDNDSFLNHDLESVYMGPTQLLFINN